MCSSASSSDIRASAASDTNTSDTDNTVIPISKERFTGTSVVSPGPGDNTANLEPMRLTLPTLAAVMAFGVLAGCVAPDPDPAPADEGGVEKQQAALPLDALPATDRNAWQPCPYLDTDWVADANGQRVTGVGIDARFDPPACQFWSYPPEPQLTVIVRHMDSPEDAMAVVDWATPIDYTEPANQPAGWNGGRHGGGAVPNRIGAAYSVAKGNTAVTVFTNQDESIKAQLVAEETIKNLQL